MAETFPIEMTREDARKLAALLRALSNTRGGGDISVSLVPGRGLTISGGRSRPPAMGGGNRMAWFVFRSPGDDHLVCRTYNPLESDPAKRIGEVDVYVAKPPDLRRTPFDGKTFNLTIQAPGWAPFLGSVTITYTSPIARTVKRDQDGLDEHQIIVPPYRSFQGTNPEDENYYPGDLILAVSMPTGIVVGEGEEAVPVIWQDMNLDGRAWARSPEEETDIEEVE